MDSENENENVDRQGEKEVFFDCITGEQIEEDEIISTQAGKTVYNFKASTLIRNYATSKSLKNPFTTNKFNEKIVRVIEGYANLTFRCSQSKFILNGFLTVAEAFVKIFRIMESMEAFSSGKSGNNFQLKNIVLYDIRVDGKSLYEMEYDAEIYEQLGRDISKNPLSEEIEHSITLHKGINPILLEKMCLYLPKTSIQKVEKIVKIMRNELACGSIIKI